MKTFTGVRRSLFVPTHLTAPGSSSPAKAASETGPALGPSALPWMSMPCSLATAALGLTGSQATSVGTQATSSPARARPQATAGPRGLGQSSVGAGIIGSSNYCRLASQEQVLGTCGAGRGGLRLCALFKGHCTTVPPWRNACVPLLSLFLSSFSCIKCRSVP